MRHRFSITVQRKTGVVARILGALDTRGLEVEALRVVPLERPGLALVTLVTTGQAVAIARVAQKIGEQVRVLQVNYESIRKGAENESFL